MSVLCATYMDTSIVYVMLLGILFLSIPSATIADELDLKEANVMSVSVTDLGEGQYDFSVTLYHDDDGEAGYADHWQVEQLDGTLLGRRVLTHAHGTVEFTRSGVITIPTGTELVIVRGHDSTHGYGGRAMVVNMGTQEQSMVNQGSEPSDFSTYSFDTVTHSTSSEAGSTGTTVSEDNVNYSSSVSLVVVLLLLSLSVKSRYNKYLS
ncbi:MAG: hypothetical protein ACW98K_10650 [Candidatus Kariarchaeaceae archaeon]